MTNPKPHSLGVGFAPPPPLPILPDLKNEKCSKKKENFFKPTKKWEGWGPEGVGAWRVEGPEGWGPDLEKVRAPRVGPRRVGPHSVGVRRVGARRVGGPKFRSFFFRLPPPFSLFLSLSGGLLVEFWWRLKRRDPQMCTFGLPGDIVWNPRPAGRQGSHPLEGNGCGAHDRVQFHCHWPTGSTWQMCTFGLGLSCETPAAPRQREGEEETHKTDTQTDHTHHLWGHFVRATVARRPLGFFTQWPQGAQSAGGFRRWTAAKIPREDLPKKEVIMKIVAGRGKKKRDILGGPGRGSGGQMKKKQKISAFEK